MKNRQFVVAAWSVLVVLVFASGVVLSQDAVSARGAELLTPFKMELKQALMAGMQKGPQFAISACKDQAPAITASLATEGIRIGRTSHRLRNPANAAPDWVEPVLKAYLEEESDRAPRVVALANNREGYIESISVKPLCLTCHGESLAPDVQKQITAMYPEDEATGFRLDDFRGVYWVEYPVAE